ncbi:predicted protein [Pyrenophora tritici-repentis Pt-1C-BFP]|uniref:Uncharacterized protein n=1 Tax=Pyrenophora tritici-repentis (strain Pt-1C-BFP) TaxID=426418 RepID=B2VZP2_PYRTR|nr:uncharacterized protein PTRG_02882 [Pyrenophora tritici-repentis Pt-1C-BFP]EDU45405.1 predicted protein [Pyrenophora tritici-repentis Pt-1C-BFP]
MTLAHLSDRISHMWLCHALTAAVVLTSTLFPSTFHVGEAKLNLRPICLHILRPLLDTVLFPNRFCIARVSYHRKQYLGSAACTTAALLSNTKIALLASKRCVLYPFGTVAFPADAIKQDKLVDFSALLARRIADFGQYCKGWRTGCIANGI